MDLCYSCSSSLSPLEGRDKPGTVEGSSDLERNWGYLCSSSLSPVEGHGQPDTVDSSSDLEQDVHLTINRILSVLDE